jgi:MFS transporter, ACS family, glucarate transporter
MESTSKTAGKESGFSKIVILILLFLGWCLGNMDRLAMSYGVVPIGKEFNLSSSLVGLVLSSFFIGYVLMQIPGGWLADKLGAKKVLNVIVFVWSVFTGLTGAAWGFAALIAIRILFGLSEAPFAPAAFRMIADVFPKKENGRAISILLSSGSLIAIVVPLLSSLMITKLGWRAMFYVIGGIGIAVVILFLIFLKPLPVHEKRPSAEAKAPEPKNMGELFKMPMVWTLIIVEFSVYTLLWGTTTWIPSYLVKARNLGLMSIGALQAIPALGSVIVMYVSGVFLDKLKARANKVISIVAAAIAALMLYLMFVCPTVALFIAYETIFSAMLGYLVPYMPTVLMKAVPTEVSGSAIGIVNVAAQLGGLVTPLIIGVLVDLFQGSFVAAFAYLIAFAVIALVCFAILKPSKEAEAS